MAQPRTDIQYVSDDARERREEISLEAVREKPAHVVSDRGERARRLLGAGRKFSPDRDAVTELIAERTAEDCRPASTMVGSVMLRTRRSAVLYADHDRAARAFGESHDGSD